MAVDFLFTIATLAYGFCLGMVAMAIYVKWHRYLMTLQYKHRYARTVIDDAANRGINAGYKGVTIDC